MSSDLEVLFSKEEINSAVEKLAAKINTDYKGKNPLVIGILKGAFMFMADLVRRLNIDLDIDFIRLSSYGPNKESSGIVEITEFASSDVNSRDILIVEDIIDTGITLSTLIEFLETKEPHSIKLCSLLDKPDRRQVQISIDYLGLTIPDKFVVGYGMDFDEKYRNLPDINILKS